MRAGVNVGSGPDHAAGWVNVDSNPVVDPDVVADACHLPFHTDGFSRAYLGHVIEHLAWPDPAVAAIREALRVAADVMVVTPDVDVADRMAACGQITADEAAGARHGRGAWDGDVHLWAATADRLRHAAHRAAAGIGDVTVTPLAITAVGDGWPVLSRIGWQTAVHLRRTGAW